MSIEAIRELGTLASVCPELNMANYTEDDVRHLNDWAIEMSLLVEKFAAIQQAEAKQPAAGEPVDFIVSAVLIKKTPDGFNTQNKLYTVEAASREEAHGKVLPLLGVDFPEHQLHTFCSRPVPSVPATGEPVGEVLSGLVGDIGVEVKWLVHGGRPLERGDKLYAQVVPDACEVWGWVIVDKNGAERSTRSRKQDILGGVYYTTAYVADDLTKADREFAGCAPHRILTLYTQPKSGK